MIILMLVFSAGVFWWNWGRLFERGVMGAARSVGRAAESVENGTVVITSTLFGIPYSTDEIRRLREDVVALRAEIEYLKEAERENILLKEALGRIDAEMQFIYARVISRPVSGSHDVILLDVGSNGGVMAGMAVLAPGNIHIGTIVEVSGRSAKVQMLSDAGGKTEVYLPQSNVTSVAEGDGLGLLSVQVPASIDIKEKEPIFTTGQRDFLVGFVEKIEKSDAGPFQIVKTKMPLHIYDLRTVFVVRGL